MKALFMAALLPCALVTGATLARASTISYTCDPNIDATSAGLCLALNTTIAADYSTIFSNAKASIYIKFATAIGAVGDSATASNLVPYTTYLTALSAHSSGDIVDTDALGSLSSAEPALYIGGFIELASALAQALGLSGSGGATATGAFCSTPGTSGCYDGIISLDIPADLTVEGKSYYFGNGTQAANQYDIFSIVEHETDNILGTSSCIGTSEMSLVDQCSGSNVSAVDLFRYQTPGNRVFESTTPGAYFSYNGGVTAVGFPYNTLANREGYADFTSNCTYVQDATACLGSPLDISTDGGAEATILDAIGYNPNAVSTVNPPPAVAEPGSLVLLGTGMAAIAALLRRRLKMGT